MLSFVHTTLGKIKKIQCNKCKKTVKKQNKKKNSLIEAGHTAILRDGCHGTKEQLVGNTKILNRINYKYKY